MGLYIQYGIIGIIFIVALLFMARKLAPSSKKGGCAKGCGCNVSLEEKKNNQ